MSGGTRIDFVSVDAARFNALRDEWRSAASSCALSRSGLRVATVLPAFVSREFGYAFPTDEELAESMRMTPRTIGRGMIALEAAGLIERKTRVKRDDKGEAIGKQRRIFLTMPEVNGQKPSQVNGQEVNGQPEVNGQKRACERTYVCPNIPDRITPDLKTRSGENPVSSYAHARELSVHLPPETDPSHSWASDVVFMTKFDEAVLDRVRAEEVEAVAINELTRFAFDYTTKSTLDFMPVYWADLLACRTDTVAEWFLNRTSRLIHLAEAA